MSVANAVQGSNILDVLKKKMRATKEECEKFKEEAEDLQRKLQVEISRREEVSLDRILTRPFVIGKATPIFFFLSKTVFPRAFSGDLVD